MNAPFTAEQFLDVMSRYNQGVWPMPVVFYLLAIVLVLLSLRPGTAGHRWMAGILAFLWAWMAVVYNWIYFAEINPAAWVFGALFMAQAALFLFVALRREPIAFRLQGDVPGITGALLLVYALLVYPILGATAGHGFPDGPTFGLPCPTTITTFGVLVWARGRVPWWLLVVPAAWGLVGSSAALQFGITEDIGLLVAAVVGTLLVVLNGRSTEPEHQQAA